MENPAKSLTTGFQGTANYTSDPRPVAQRIIADIRSEARSLDHASKKRSVRISEKDEFSPGIIVKPLLAPLVFTATNAKAQMKEAHLLMALKLMALLKNLHLRPVFIPTITGQHTLGQQITQLLHYCPILVSLYLPEPRNRLDARHASSEVPEAQKYDFAPSAWTTFEEAYMLSLRRGRHVYRLRESSVFPPPFVEPSQELLFRSEEGFDKQLLELRSRINMCIESDSWRDALHACGDELASKNVDLDRIELSDPEEWLNDQLKRARAGVKAKKPPVTRAGMSEGGIWDNSPRRADMGAKVRNAKAKEATQR